MKPVVNELVKLYNSHSDFSAIELIFSKQSVYNGKQIRQEENTSNGTFRIFAFRTNSFLNQNNYVTLHVLDNPLKEFSFDVNMSLATISGRLDKYTLRTKPQFCDRFSADFSYGERILFNFVFRGEGMIIIDYLDFIGANKLPIDNMLEFVSFTNYYASSKNK